MNADPSSDVKQDRSSSGSEGNMVETRPRSPGTGTSSVVLPLEEDAVKDATTASRTSTAPNCVRDDITEPEMAKEIAKISIPCCVSLACVFVAQAITISFVGHRLGSTVLAQFAVGLSVYNVLGCSLGIGFSGALDTLAPQAFGADTKTKSLAILFQRSTFFHIVFLLPISVTFFYVEPLLELVFGPVLGRGAAEFLRHSPLLLFVTWVSMSFNRLFPAQHLANVSFVANVVAVVVSAPANAYALGVVGNQLSAGVLALTIAQTGVLATHCGFALFHPRSLLKRCFIPTSETLDWKGLETMFRLGCAAMSGTCSEWWASEMLQVFAARIGEKEAAAFTVTLNIVLLFFVWSFGIGVGAGTMVGNSCGAGKPQLAERYFRLLIKLVVCVFSLTAMLLALFGPYLFQIYTQDPELLSLLVSILPFMVGWHLTDSFVTVTLGVFRGAGKPKVAAIGALSTLWLVGIPLAAYLGLVARVGLRGIILGQILGQVLLIVLRLRDLHRWDWVTLAAEAVARVTTGAPTEQAAYEGDNEPDGGVLTSRAQLSLTSIHLEDQRHSAVEDELEH
jgi:MATE family multidrug resistance protein